MKNCLKLSLLLSILFTSLGINAGEVNQSIFEDARTSVEQEYLNIREKKGLGTITQAICYNSTDFYWQRHIKTAINEGDFNSLDLAFIIDRSDIEQQKKLLFIITELAADKKISGKLQEHVTSLDLKINEGWLRGNYIVTYNALTLAIKQGKMEALDVFLKSFPAIMQNDLTVKSYSYPVKDDDAKDVEVELSLAEYLKVGLAEKDKYRIQAATKMVKDMHDQQMQISQDVFRIVLKLHTLGQVDENFTVTMATKIKAE